MVFLSNVSYLMPYCSPEFSEFVVQKTIKRLKNEMKMQKYQSRYIQINLTALARMYHTPTLSEEAKKSIIEFTNSYAE